MSDPLKEFDEVRRAFLAKSREVMAKVGAESSKALDADDPERRDYLTYLARSISVIVQGVDGQAIQTFDEWSHAQLGDHRHCDFLDQEEL